MKGTVLKLHYLALGKKEIREYGSHGIYTNNVCGPSNESRWFKLKILFEIFPRKTELGKTELLLLQPSTIECYQAIVVNKQ